MNAIVKMLKRRNKELQKAKWADAKRRAFLRQKLREAQKAAQLKGIRAA